MGTVYSKDNLRNEEECVYQGSGFLLYHKICKWNFYTSVVNVWDI